MESLYAVVSDIHGNYSALEAVVRDAEQICLTIGTSSNTFQYICLGDLVDYGPQPNDCMAWLLRTNPIIQLRGNHDIEAIEPFLRRPILVGREWWSITQWTRLALETQYHPVLKQLPEVLKGSGDLAVFSFFHAFPGSGNTYNNTYIEDNDTALRAFQVLEAQNIHYGIFGHSHYQGRFSYQFKKVIPTWANINSPAGRDVLNHWHTLPRQPTLLNPGSVGRPRFHTDQVHNWQPHAAYMLLRLNSTDGWQFMWRQVPYDPTEQINLLKASQWPKTLEIERGNTDYNNYSEAQQEEWLNGLENTIERLLQPYHQKLHSGAKSHSE